MAGPAGAIAGAALGPLLEPLVSGAWAEISESARMRQTDVLFWAVHAGVPIEKMEERIKASEQTKLLTGLALSAAARTVWEDKVRTLGRSLASGLLAEDNATIDTEQMIIAAIADIEGPQLAMLELLVARRPSSRLLGPLDLPAASHAYFSDGRWDVASREWSGQEIADARPNLAPISLSLLGALQRHGLVVQNDTTRGVIHQLFEHLTETRVQNDEAVMSHYEEGLRFFARKPIDPTIPEPSWSPTELGEQVFLRFREAGTQLEDAWSAGPANSQQQP
jgi:hypothetical protein